MPYVGCPISLLGGALGLTRTAASVVLTTVIVRTLTTVAVAMCNPATLGTKNPKPACSKPRKQRNVSPFAPQLVGLKCRLGPRPRLAHVILPAAGRVDRGMDE